MTGRDWYQKLDKSEKKRVSKEFMAIYVPKKWKTLNILAITSYGISIIIQFVHMYANTQFLWWLFPVFSLFGLIVQSTYLFKYMLSYEEKLHKWIEETKLN